MFSKRQGEEKQEEFWIERGRVSKPSSQGFYSKLNEHLAAMDFARQVWALCAPAYREESRGGRPGIDPVVYFKMLMVGFFENLRSERAIAARCEDSLSVRAFLGYGLGESTPDHSSLSVIRHRLGPEIYQGVFEVVLSALKAHGLLKGRHLGIDSSVIEANASLRTLVHRNTEQAYWEYVKELAEKEGVDPQDEGAVRRFDKNRPGRRTSNEEWKNPHDPQAKVGRTKDGACDMIYKPEHVSHLLQWWLPRSCSVCRCLPSPRPRPQARLRPLRYHGCLMASRISTASGSAPTSPICRRMAAPRRRGPEQSRIRLNMRRYSRTTILQSSTTQDTASLRA